MDEAAIHGVKIEFKGAEKLEPVKLSPEQEKLHDQALKEAQNRIRRRSQKENDGRQ